MAFSTVKYPVAVISLFLYLSVYYLANQDNIKHLKALLGSDSPKMEVIITPKHTPKAVENSVVTSRTFSSSSNLRVSIKSSTSEYEQLSSNFDQVRVKIFECRVEFRVRFSQYSFKTFGTFCSVKVNLKDVVT